MCNDKEKMSAQFNIIKEGGFVICESTNLQIEDQKIEQKIEDLFNNRGLKSGLRKKQKYQVNSQDEYFHLQFHCHVLQLNTFSAVVETISIPENEKLRSIWF